MLLRGASLARRSVRKQPARRLRATRRSFVTKDKQTPQKENKTTCDYNLHPWLANLGITESVNHGVFNGTWQKGNGAVVENKTPHYQTTIAGVSFGNNDDYEACVKNAAQAQKEWRELPMPVRGDIVRQIGEALREKKKDLGKLVSLEVGKILSEGEGEVQEFIDICDFAVGLSRTLNGQVLPSERPNHKLLEVWNPLGTVGIITAFNFPVAVFGWNAAISLVCGNTHVWKPAPSTPLTSIATQKIVVQVLKSNNINPAVATMILGDGKIGESIAADARMPLVSFTGSTKVGKLVNQTVAGRLGRSLLELGGNNAIIVMENSDIDMAITSTAFAAVGTTGQRCTSCRRAFIHENVYDKFVEGLIKAYGKMVIGNPLDDTTMCGPLHSAAALEQYEKTLKEAKQQGGKILYGGKVMTKHKGHYVEPTIVSISPAAKVVQQETFAPILYISKVNNLKEAIELNNSVPQGLSSALFSRDLNDVMRWTGPAGSDCGIINVNTSCSGAEIGGAFGGEKETGGGRESGSDAWKQYMRRGTVTINHGESVALAQGVEFDV